MAVEATPDALRYVAAASRRVPRPFHLRWLIPKLCGESERRWRLQSQLTTWGLFPLVWWYVGGWRGIAAAVMVTGLAGVWKFNRRFPILVDAAGMFCALLTADLFTHGLWPLALLVVLIGACVRETVPVFAALFAWNPLALIGLLPVAVRALQHDGPDPEGNEPWQLTRQLRTCIQIHRAQPVGLFVLPWGAALVCLANGSPQLALTLSIAYAQMAVATDTVRLYQWAFPVVLASAVHAVPLRWLPLLVVVQLANPYASEGG